jgi:hypothetical protein
VPFDNICNLYMANSLILPLINKQMFFLDKHRVLRNTPKKDGAHTRLVIPVKLRETVIELCHELPSAGHQGTERTLSRIKDKFHWYPNRAKNLLIAACAVISVVCDGSGIHSVHFVNWSTIMSTERTLSRIKDKFHWYNMSRDIRTFVLTCEVCSKHKKPTRNARCQMTPYHAGAVSRNFTGITNLVRAPSFFGVLRRTPCLSRKNICL